jgi:hypothetical protein
VANHLLTESQSLSSHSIVRQVELSLVTATYRPVGIGDGSVDVLDDADLLSLPFESLIDAAVNDDNEVDHRWTMTSPV